MKKTSTHISFERLADLAEGRLDTKDERAMRGHLSSCADCNKELAAIEQITSLMREDETEDAPRDVIFNAVRLFDARRAGQRAGVLCRLVAALAFDSNSQRPAYGLRSSRTAAARQLLFNAGDEIDVDLRLTPESGKWRIKGQLLGECGGGGRIEAFAAGRTEPIASAVINELCEFALEPLSSGDYTLRLMFSGVEIEIRPLMLGEDEERENGSSVEER